MHISFFQRNVRTELGISARSAVKAVVVVVVVVVQEGILYLVQAPRWGPRLEEVMEEVMVVALNRTRTSYRLADAHVGRVLGRRCTRFHPTRVRSIGYCVGIG